MNRAMHSKPKRIHHLDAHTGKASVMNKEMPPNSTMRMERGIKACWMVLSMKLMLPCTKALGIRGSCVIRLCTWAVIQRLRWRWKLS